MEVRNFVIKKLENRYLTYFLATTTIKSLEIDSGSVQLLFLIDALFLYY